MTPPRPIDYDAIRRALVSAVAQATGLDVEHVVMAEPEIPNAPRPTLPYVSMKLTSAAIRYGQDALTVDAQGVQHLGGQRGIVVSVNTYGRSHEEAYGVMAALQFGLDNPAVLDPLRAAGIAVWWQGAVGDLSMLLETGYEGRAQMDVFLGVAGNIQSAVDTVGSVEVVGNIQGATAVDITTKGL